MSGKRSVESTRGCYACEKMFLVKDLTKHPKFPEGDKLMVCAPCKEDLKATKYAKLLKRTW